MFRKPLLNPLEGAVQKKQSYVFGAVHILRNAMREGEEVSKSVTKCYRGEGVVFKTLRSKAEKIFQLKKVKIVTKISISHAKI